MRILAVTLFAVLAFASPALASSVTNVSVDNSAPSSAAGARTSYVVGFKATNGVAAAAKITVTFPVGATFSGWVGGTVNVGATAIGTCGAPSNGVVDCTLFTGQTIANGTDVVVTLNGVTNPGNGANTLNVRTTADADPVNAQFALTAAGTLTQVTVNNASPSTAAGARTRYLTSFKLSATGGLSAQANSRVTVLFPPNTSFLGWAGGVLTVDGTDVGTCSGPSTNTVQCSLFTGRTIASGATVQLALNGVTNTTDVGQRTISVDTTSDPASTPSAPFTVAAAGAVTGVTVDNTVPSAAAGARTQYVVRFTTSATGGLSAAANSRISIPFQSGTGFTGWAGGVISAGGDDVGNCAGPNGLLVECSLFTGDAIAPNTQVTITFSGVTNPGTPGTATKLSVGTTSDPGLVFSANFTVLSAGTLSAVTVANGAPTAASGARTRFVVGFTLSATGGLSAAANSRLDFTFPTGTTFGGWAGGTISVGGTAVGNCSAPNGLAVQCALFTDRSIAAGAAVTVTFAGVTNPAAAGADKAMTVATTSDPAVTASAPFTVVPAGAVSGVTAANDVPSRGAGARTRYVVGFIASATGALSAEANSRLTFTFPAGTTFGGWAGATMRDVTRGADVGICSAPSGLNVECALFTSQFVNAGDSVRVTFEGVANPTVPSAGNTVSVSTTSDPQTIASAPFSVVAGGALTDVGVTVASLTPSARTRYVVRLRASATGGLSEAANSRLDVTFPAGTTFTGWSGGSVLDVSRGVTVGICSAPNGLAVQCALFTDAFTAAGDELRITFGDVTNPAAAGPQQLSVSTTSDTPVVTSASYREGDTVAPDTTIDSGPTGGPPDSTRSFTFSASEPGGTFECRVDAGPFTACASPHTTPPQANGTYTFQVRAVDAGGNPDPTPAGRAFTITGVAPETTVRSGPSGTTENASPVFTFDSPDANATFECALDGAFTPCASPKAYSGLGEGEHLFRVRAVDAAGLPDPTPATRAFTVRTTPAVTPTPTATPAATSTSVPTATATATPTPTPAPTAPPVQNRSVTAEPVSGSVLVNVGGKFVPLNAQVVTNGTEIDVRKGKIELTTAAGEKAVFYDGIFKVSQSGGITTLTLTEKLDCPTSKGRARASAKKPKSRKLWGDGKGKFRTKGSYSAATIRGTRWLVQDTCTSTLTRVAEGVVSVQDFGRKRTITLRAGKRYTATRR